MNEECGVKFVIVIKLGLLVGRGTCTSVLIIVDPGHLLDLGLIHSEAFWHLLGSNSLDSVVELLLQLGLAHVNRHML